LDWGFAGTSWSLQRAADLELKTGLDGIATFLRKKAALHQMDNLTDELQEHSSLLPRGKMLRVRYIDGLLIYEAAPMRPLQLGLPASNQELWQTIEVRGRPSQRGSRDDRTLADAQSTCRRAFQAASSGDRNTMNHE
jgi:hypothetical protein